VGACRLTTPDEGNMVAKYVKRTTHRVAALAVIALVATACGGGTDPVDGESPTDTETTEAGGGDVDPADYCSQGGSGTLVWAHEQEPPDLHLDDPNNNLSITSWVRQSMWEGLYGVSAATEFFPELLASEAEVTENEDGSVTIGYTLRDGLTWSDGTALTADHVKGTFDIIMEGFDPETGEGGVYLIGSRLGYELITDFTVDSETEFTVTMSEFFAGYKALFSEIFPTHVVADAAAANEAFPEFEADGETLPSSGPMLYDGRERGVSMSLVRNDSYHGSVSPDVTNEGVACVDGVQINWVADTDAQINALKAGEADIIFTQPQTAFGDRISTDENFTVASEAGPVFEHWGLNLYNTHLSDPNVREALAYALDKSQVMAALYTPLFGDSLDPNGLGNTYWLSNQSNYENHQAKYDGAQPDAAKAALEAAGYADSGDGIYEHPEKGRLTMRVGTTGGNALRELQQQLIVEQMKAGGIEVTIDNVPGGDYFGERPFSPDAIECSTSGGTAGNCEIWDITQFAWVGGPWPGGQSASYLTGSGNNPYGFANEEFDAKATECDGTVDDAERAACYNELDKYVTTLELDPEQGLFMLPLTQKPSFYAFSNVRLAKGAVSPDANSAGPLVNVVDYVPAG
jgi:peptide/nickel transport system substrate-binding protein